MNKREAVKKINAEFEAWGYSVTVRNDGYGEYVWTVRKRNAVTGLITIVDRAYESTHADALDTARAVIDRDRRLSFVIVYSKIDALFKPLRLRLTVDLLRESVTFSSEKTGKHTLNLKTRTPEEILTHAEGFVQAQQTWLDVLAHNSLQTPDEAYISSVESVATHALYACGVIRSDEPKDEKALNRWLTRWTGARLYTHWPEDGGQFYWSGGDSDGFYRQTVTGVRRAGQLTYGQWLEDYSTRLRNALAKDRAAANE